MPKRVICTQARANVHVGRQPVNGTKIELSRSVAKADRGFGKEYNSYVIYKKTLRSRESRDGFAPGGVVG